MNTHKPLALILILIMAQVVFQWHQDSPEANEKLASSQGELGRQMKEMRILLVAQTVVAFIELLFEDGVQFNSIQLAEITDLQIVNATNDNWVLPAVVSITKAAVATETGQSSRGY